MESNDDVQFNPNPNTDLGTYMVDNATSWYGFWTSGVAGINAADLAIYMDWPGFINGTSNIPASTSASRISQGTLPFKNES